LSVPRRRRGLAEYHRGSPRPLAPPPYAPSLPARSVRGGGARREARAHPGAGPPPAARTL